MAALSITIDDVHDIDVEAAERGVILRHRSAGTTTYCIVPKVKSAKVSKYTSSVRVSLGSAVMIVAPLSWWESHGAMIMNAALGEGWSRD